VELLTGGMALWSLIRDDKLFQLPSLLQRGRGFGMIRIEDSLNALVATGTVTVETAKIFADDARLIGQVPAPGSGAGAPESASNRRKGNVLNPFAKKDS
jgi:twitching motility protein PilT